MKEIIMFIIFILLWFLGIIKLNYWLIIIGSFGIGYTIASVGFKNK